MPNPFASLAISDDGPPSAPGANPFASLAQDDDEPGFRSWYQEHAKRLKLNPDPDDPQHFYDYRAAYRAGAKPDATGHWPSEYKREGHPRMVVDGVNTKTGEKVQGADGLDLGGDKEVKPVQIGLEAGQTAPGADARARREKPTLGQSLRGGAGEIANVFEGLSVAAEKAPVIGPAVSLTKTALQAPGAATGALYGGLEDPEAWTTAYDEAAAALAKRLGKSVEELTWDERIRAMPGVGTVAAAHELTPEEVPTLTEVVANAGKGTKVGEFSRELVTTAATLGVDIVSDPTVLLTGNARSGGQLLKFAATGKEAGELTKGLSRGKAAVEGLERVVGSSASGLLYGPEAAEGVLRGVEEGNIPQALGSALVAGMMLRGVKHELEGKLGRPPLDSEVMAELEKLKQRVEAEKNPVQTPAEIRAGMPPEGGPPAAAPVESALAGAMEKERRLAPEPQPVESAYARARKAEEGLKANWDDIKNLAHEEAMRDVAEQADGVDKTAGVTPYEEAIVNAREGERRVGQAQVEQERRVQERRAAHAKLVASETGLPENSPAVERIVHAEIDAATGLLGKPAWERDLAKHPEGGGISVDDMGGTKFINDTFGHANGDRFIEAKGRALLEAVDEINRRHPEAEARGYRPHGGGDEGTVLASTPEFARMAHQLAQENFAKKRIVLDLSDGVQVVYEGGVLDFNFGALKRGEVPHDAYARIDRDLEALRKDLIARGERAPRGTRPLSLREVDAGGPPRAGGEGEHAPARAEAPPGEPAAGGEGEGRGDLVEDEPPPPPPVTSHNHVTYGGGKEYFVAPHNGEPHVFKAEQDAPIDTRTGQREGAQVVGKMDRETQQRVVAEARADALEADERAERLSGEMRAPVAGARSGKTSRADKVAGEVVDQVREDRQGARAKMYGQDPAAAAAPMPEPSAGGPPEAPPPVSPEGPPPAPGGPPHPPGVPKYARPSSINLWQRIDHGEDVINLFQETAHQFAGLVDEAKRGTMTLAQIQQMASALGSTDEAVVRALSRRAGQALNAEKLWAVNEGLKETARATVEHARQFLEIPEAQRTPEQEAALLQQIARHTAVFASVSGANAEAGRALGVLNRIRANFSNAEKLKELIDSYGRSPDGARKNVAEIAALLSKVDPDDARALGKFARAITEPTRGDKIYEYWINAILSGPPSHVSNAISGVLGSALYPVELGLAAGVDAARGVAERVLKGEEAPGRERYFGEMSHAAKQLLGALDLPLQAAEAMGLARKKLDAEDLPYLSFRRGIREATAAALQAWRTEAPVVGETTRTAEMQPRGGAIGGKLGRAVRTPTRTLLATDQFFQALVYRMSLNAQAYRQTLKELGEGATRHAIADRMGQLLSDPSAVTRDAAAAEAAYRTFNNDPGEFTKDMMRFKRRYPWLGWVVPFMSTPVNIVKFGAQRTPGIAHLTFGKALYDYAKGKITAEQLGDSGARMIVATGVMLAVGELVANGDISGAGPKDPAERRTKEATGWKPYSIRVGDDWYSYVRVEPMGVPMRMTADFVEAWQRGDKQPDELPTQIIHAATRNILDLPMVSGLAGLFKTIMDYERYGEAYALRTGASLLPAIFGYARRATDPERKLPRSIQEAITEKVPGAGKVLGAITGEDPTDVAKALDIYGRAELLEDTWWERFASPFHRNPVRHDLVTPHLLRLGINLGAPSKKLDDWKDPETGKPLPQPKGRDAGVLAEARGLARYALASMVVSQQDFMAMPEDEQQETLRAVLAKGSAVVTRRAKGLLASGQPLSMEELVGELLEFGPPELAGPPTAP